jgi:hypothetical protein
MTNLPTSQEASSPPIIAAPPEACPLRARRDEQSRVATVTRG